MPIANYTTKKSSTETANDLEVLLVRAGAEQVLREYENGTLVAFKFKLNLAPPPDMPQYLIIRLVPTPDGVLATFKRDHVERRYNTPDQARRTAWRIVYNWIVQQLAMIDAQQSSLGQLLLGFSETQEGGSIFHMLIEGRARALLSESF